MMMLYHAVQQEVNCTALCKCLPHPNENAGGDTSGLCLARCLPGDTALVMVGGCAACCSLQYLWIGLYGPASCVPPVSRWVMQRLHN